MSRLRLAFLDASHQNPRTPQNFRRELDADLVEFDVTKGDLPPDVTDAACDFDGAVVSGSRSSVYGEEAWIDGLVSWVADAADHDVPILGVCFGHQVLAEALGGTVERMGKFEIGYNEVEHRGDDLFDGVADRFTVFTTHGDVVTDLPSGATLTAENEYGVHGFRKGHAFGVQFHPEYDMATAEEITNTKEFLGEERLDAVLDGVTTENYEAACEAKQLFDNFVRHVETVRTEDAAQTASPTPN